MPTQQSGHSVKTLWATDDFPPGWHNRSLKYSEYDCVAIEPPVRKIIDGVTHGGYQDGF
jgi:hypothetical protein